MVVPYRYDRFGYGGTVRPLLITQHHHTTTTSIFSARPVLVALEFDVHASSVYVLARPALHTVSHSRGAPAKSRDLFRFSCGVGIALPLPYHIIIAEVTLLPAFACLFLFPCVSLHDCGMLLIIACVAVTVQQEW